MSAVSVVSHVLSRSFPICFTISHTSSRAYFHESMTKLPSFAHASFNGENSLARMSIRFLAASPSSSVPSSASSVPSSGIWNPPMLPPAPLPWLSFPSTFRSSNEASALSAAFPAASTPSARSSAPPAASASSPASIPASAVGMDIPSSLDKMAPACFAIAISCVRIVFRNLTTGVSATISPPPITESSSLNCSLKILVWFAQLSVVFAKSPAASAVCSMT